MAFRVETIQLNIVNKVAVMLEGGEGGWRDRLSDWSTVAIDEIRVRKTFRSAELNWLM